MSRDIYLGTDKQSGQAIRLPRSLIQSGHTVIRGMTGSGKTSKIIIPAVQQLMQSYEDETGELRRDAIVIIDLGGDQNAFHRTWEAAERMKRKFRFLSLEANDDTAYFPALQFLAEAADPVFVATHLVNSFHLDFGLVYGAMYFAYQSLAALHNVAGALIEETQVPTLKDVARFLESSQNKRQFKDADQIRTIFQFLAEYPQLGFDPAGNSDNEILLTRAIEDAEVLYFFLPSLQHSMIARLVAGLALFSTVTSQIQRYSQRAPRRHVYLSVDEFQEIVGTGLSRLLAQTRKYDITMLLAHQATSQLENRDTQLADTVFEGTNVKIYFTCVGERDTRELQALSKDKVRKLRAKSDAPLATSEQLQVVPKLERDDIMEVSSTADDAFLLINDGKGHHEPMVMRTAHDVSVAKFRELKNKPLPQREKPVPSREREVFTRSDPARPQRRQAAIAQCIEAILKERQWENDTP
jgi:type IV secretory pathway TraG/TraD family ATPase VirD4